MINQDRIKKLLLELVQIDSHSRKERDVAERIKQHCVEMGANVEIDDAGEKVGGNSGNVIARFRGTIPGAEPIMMSAHMDTVVPGEGVKPIIEGDIIRTDQTTVLGGDDKSGCAVIIETIRCLQEQNIPHTDIEAVFSICEEVGLLGAKHLDVSKIRSKYGIVFDSDDPGFLFTKGPSANHLEFKVYGLESHAGVAPEYGISAIKIAAEAIAKMKLFRIDEETTANIGVIEGGKATNIITNLVYLKGEARSLNENKLKAQCDHMVKCFEEAAAKYEVTVEGRTTKGRVESIVEPEYFAMDVPDDSRVVQLVLQAATRMGLKVETMASGGGCDANIFNRKGIECANLGTGMRAIHTVNEWLDVKDMYASAEMTLEIMKLNGELATKAWRRDKGGIYGGHYLTIRWTHITITVSNIGRSIDFYTTLCSLSVLRDRRREGGGTVWLGPLPQPGEDPTFVLVISEGEVTDRLDHFGFQCESREQVDSIAEEAGRHGKLVHPPQDSGGVVGYWAIIKDPDGHSVEFTFGQPLKGLG